MYMLVVRQGPSVSNFGKLEIAYKEFVSLVWVSSMYSNLKNEVLKALLQSGTFWFLDETINTMKIYLINFILFDNLSICLRI